jgi:hypothetical protein
MPMEDLFKRYCWVNNFYVNRFDWGRSVIAIDWTDTSKYNLVKAASTTPSPSLPPVQITFIDLMVKPEIYNQQTIIVEGYWFDGFEIVVLAERLEPDSFASGNVKPAGSLIWIKGGLSPEVGKQLYLQPNNPTGYPAHYGKVVLTGKFETGSKYGHFDAYKYQLTVIAGKLLDWSLTP